MALRLRLVHDVVAEHWVRGRQGLRVLGRRKSVGTVPVEVDGAGPQRHPLFTWDKKNTHLRAV